MSANFAPVQNFVREPPQRTRTQWWHIAVQPPHVDERPTTMADSGVDTVKIVRLDKVAAAARLGG
jgi:hypothetical protein